MIGQTKTPGGTGAVGTIGATIMPDQYSSLYNPQEQDELRNQLDPVIDSCERNIWEHQKAIEVEKEIQHTVVKHVLDNAPHRIRLKLANDLYYLYEIDVHLLAEILECHVNSVAHIVGPLVDWDVWCPTCESYSQRTFTSRTQLKSAYEGHGVWVATCNTCIRGTP